MDASTTDPIALPNGPLTSFFALAEQNKSLAVYTFEQFADPAGVALVGASDYCVALVDPADDTAVKVAGKIAGGTGTPSPDGKAKRFEGAEHTMIGDSITLRMSLSHPENRTPSPQVPLKLGQGTFSLRYGQILALGGDFFGRPDLPISDGATFADQMNRFELAFATLDMPPAGPLSTAILNVMQTEINALNAALAAGVSPDEAYKALGDRLSGQWNRLTGGGGLFSDLWPMGRYLQLAWVNWDHFGKSAVAAYQAGHAAAMDQAYEGWAQTTQKDNPQLGLTLLNYAYAMNAFADHFLTDLFSAGHLRVPRKELYATCPPALAANLCAKAMHDEDSKFGLRVTSASNPVWVAYGDGHFFDTRNLQNRAYAVAAVQASADEIFNVFRTGQIPSDPSTYAALALAPNIDEQLDPLNDPMGNFAPLFITYDGSANLRTYPNSLQTHAWTSGWTASAAVLFFRWGPYDPGPLPYAVAPPTTAPTFSQSAPGTSSTVQVSYCVSFVGLIYESVVGPFSATMTVSNSSQQTLTGIPVADPMTATVSARNIYRQIVGTPIAFCGTLKDNSTRTFVDTLPSMGPAQ